MSVIVLAVPPPKPAGEPQLMLHLPCPTLTLTLPTPRLEISMPNGPFTVGNVGTTLTGVCSDGGTPIDLAGSTVTLQIRNPAGTVISRQASLGQDTGRWTYAWAAGDLDKPGTWLVQVDVTNATTKPQSFGPEAFQVREHYDTTA